MGGSDASNWDMETNQFVSREKVGLSPLDLAIIGWERGSLPGEQENFSEVMPIDVSV